MFVESIVKWIDAAEFQDFGEWQLDTQFTHLMGCGYLLACKAPGTPVKDALVSVDMPSSGLYRVWVRAKNWYYPYAPGQFKLRINGALTDTTFGAMPSCDWVWQIAGDFQLEKGANTIALVDITGYFGRCSSIVITDSFEYIPPRPLALFEAARAEAKHIDLTPKLAGTYDVAVAGAGPGGVPSAIAAARHGAKTLLITNRPVLGGNASTEAGVGFNGASARQTNAREGGINEEIIRIKAKLGCSWTRALEILCEKEPNLTILYNQHICGAQTKDDCITSVTAKNTCDGTYITINAKLFIDCTGDGWLGFHAGAAFRLGREAKRQFHEEFAPENADTLSMSGCVVGSRFTDSGAPVEYAAPDWVPRFAKGKDFGRNIENIGFAWWNEAPNDLDDIYDAELARDEIFRVVIGYFNYLKNDWDKKELAANYVFTNIRGLDAKRESRRFIGDYTLTQNDCVNGTAFHDVVSHTGWPIDLHHPKGMYSGREGPFFSNTHVPLVQFPFRCLYSKNIKNLMFAGRNASVTHVALGTARVQASIAAMGQAAGTAAAMCVRCKITPRTLYETRIGELQQTLIKDDQFIPGVKNELSSDIARTCAADASSENKCLVYWPHLGTEDAPLPLDRQRATFFARGVPDTVDTLYLKLVNSGASSVPVTIHVRTQADPDGYTTAADTAVVTRDVPPNSIAWIPFDINIKTALRYLWVYIDKTPNISWCIWKYPALDWTRSERMSDDEEFKNIRWQTHCLSMTKPDEKLANCSPANVVAGYDRIHDAEHYGWVSDPTQGLPQWIRLTLPAPAHVDELHITFDSDMNSPPMLNPLPALPISLVSAYRVDVLVNGEWICVGEDEDNFMRKCVVRIDKTISAARVTVTASGDGCTARIFKLMLL